MTSEVETVEKFTVVVSFSDYTSSGTYSIEGEFDSYDEAVKAGKSHMNNNNDSFVVNKKFVRVE